MFPEYPEVEKRATRNVNAAIRQQIGIASPLLAEIHRFFQHEGTDWDLLRADGSRDRSGYQKAEVASSISKEALKTGDFGAVLKMVVEVAKGMAEQRSNFMFARMSEALEEIGNVVRVGGEFTQDALIEMLEKKHVEFDPKTNEPSGEMIVIDPETWKKLEPIMRGWESDQKFKARYAALMEQKRRDWREREASRKLVD